MNGRPAIVIRFGAFGDMILLLPLLRYLQAQHGQPVQLVSSGGWTLPLMSRQSCVADVRLLSSRKTPYLLNRSQQDFVAWLRAQSDAEIYLCETDEKSRWLVDKAGLDPQRLHWAADEPERADEHWIERWLRLAAKWTGNPFDLKDVQAILQQGWLDLEEADREDLRQWCERRGWAGRSLLVLQPGSKRTMRRGAVDRSSNNKFWPVENWATLAKRLIEDRPERQILIAGSPEESEFTGDIAELAASERIVSVADDLPIPRLLALLEAAEALISVDTGPAHAAAALDCPELVLFGEMNPRRWQPYARRAPVQVLQSNPPGPIRDLALESVWSAWKELARQL